MKRYKFKILKEKKHSKEFLKLLKEASPDKAIRAITHANPLLVFWVSPDGKVIDALNAHHDNPPSEDRSILSHKSHKGHLRGRAALIGDVVYIVIYGEEQDQLTRKQHYLLRKSYPAILRKIKEKNKKVPSDIIDNALFITENGSDIEV